MRKTVTTEKIILGIDPGTNFMGYGIIKTIGHNKMELISMGTVDMSKYNTHQDKLKRIFDRICYLIDEYQPDECAIEAPFHGKNVQSMLKLGRAQGVAMVAALTNNIDIVEYAPKKVKQSITGSGSASKEQVAAMLQQLLKFRESPKYMDATDGLAVAVCHHFQGKWSGGNGKKHNGWGDFIKSNPSRVSK